MIDAFKIYAPETFDLVSQSISDASTDLGFLRLAKESWSKLENISIDYAIMEKAQNLVVVSYASKWSDLGGWDAVWSESKPDEDGNVTSENAHAVECIIVSCAQNKDLQIVGLGLDNIMRLPCMTQYLLLKRARGCKKTVSSQDKDFSREVTQKIIARGAGLKFFGNRFQVKRICVKPGSSLSLQSHNHRSEHWVVVEGRAKVTVDQEVQFI